MSTEEPMVLTEDVQEAVVRAKRSMPVPLIAELAKLSERTIYRVIDGEYDRLMDLGDADSILMAVDGDLTFCRLEWPAGTIE